MSETLLVVVQWKTRYVYTHIYIYIYICIYRYVRHTFVARSWGDEVVVTSTAKESLRSTERGSLEVLAVL